MLMLNNLLDLLAVLIQIIGTYILVKGSPENTFKGAVIYSNNEDFKKIEKQNKKMKNGFKILLFGLAIQGISVGIKFFNITSFLNFFHNVR
jgi:hypothetical protein